MPSVSRAQHNLMSMASTARGRAKLHSEGKKIPPEAVAMEYREADKGKRFKAKHVRKKY